MAEDTTITITDNDGDNNYKQSAREFLTSPILVDMLKIILQNEDQINNNIKIRNETSFGVLSNRDIMIRNYISATDFTNLIIDIPLRPALLLDGSTYFQIALQPNSTLELLFSFEQVNMTIPLQ